MPIVIGIVSQKGGVGKSALSRTIAAEFTKNSWSVLLADMDISQKTSYEWGERRRMLSDCLPVESSGFYAVEDVLKEQKNFDLIVFDGAPHATLATKQIASASTIVVLPTSTSLDDLNPQIRLAHELVEEGIPTQKIMFCLNKVGNSEVELNDALLYLSQTSYKVLKGYIPEKTAFRQALRQGKSLLETSYTKLNSKTEELIQSLIKELN
jgi:chromosome partitioning protein